MILERLLNTRDHKTTLQVCRDPCRTLEYDRQCPTITIAENSFKFKNLQLVRKPNTVRQTRQNTDLRTHGTAEEQFAAITATACAEVLREFDNISSDDESVDYSPPEQLPLEHKLVSEITVNKFLIRTKLTKAHLKLLQTVH